MSATLASSSESASPTIITNLLDVDGLCGAWMRMGNVLSVLKCDTLGAASSLGANIDPLGAAVALPLGSGARCSATGALEAMCASESCPVVAKMQAIVGVDT